mgnify:CR=1 FL=1
MERQQEESYPATRTETMESETGNLLAWSWHPTIGNSGKIGITNLKTKEEYANFEAVKLQKIRGDDYLQFSIRAHYFFFKI